MLGRMRMNVEECTKQFFNVSKQVFGEPKFFKGLPNLARSKYMRLGQEKRHSAKLEAVLREAVENRSKSDPSQTTESQFKSSPEQCKWYANIFFIPLSYHRNSNSALVL